MRSCPRCGEKEFWHCTPGHASWCEICGYTEQLDKATTDHEDDCKDLASQDFLADKDMKDLMREDAER